MSIQLVTQRVPYSLQPFPKHKQDSGGGGGGGQITTTETVDTFLKEVQQQKHLLDSFGNEVWPTGPSPTRPRSLVRLQGRRDGSFTRAPFKVMLEDATNAPPIIKDEGDGGVYVAILRLLGAHIDAVVGCDRMIVGVLSEEGSDKGHREPFLPGRYTHIEWQRDYVKIFMPDGGGLLLKGTRAFLEALRRLSDIANEGNAGGTLSPVMAGAQTQKEVGHAEDHDTADGGLKDLIALDIDTPFSAERGSAIYISGYPERLIKSECNVDAYIAVGPPQPDPYGVLNVFADNEESKVALPTDLGLYWEPKPPPPPSPNVISRDNEEVMVILPTDLDCYWNF